MRKSTKKFFHAKKKDRHLFFEAFSWSFRTWFYTSFFSLKYYYSWLGNRIEKPDLINTFIDNATKEKIEDIKDAIRRCTKYAPWKSTCLIQAITTKKMLSKRKIDSLLFLSLNKKTNQLSAHAWVKVGKDIILGKEIKEFQKEFFIYK